MRKFLLVLVMIMTTIPLYCQTYTMSNDGIELIKHYEGLVLTKKNGYIGYGHHVKKNEHYTHITKEKANEILLSDITLTNKMINDLLKPVKDKLNFTQGFIDGFGSFIYNCGIGNVKKSKFYNKLIRCETNDELDLALLIIPYTYCSCSGLKKRRKSEYHLMKYGELNFKIEGKK